MLRRNVLRVLVALGFVISSVAVAQDATTPPPAAPPPAAPPPAAPQSAVVGEAPAAAPAAKGDEERTEEIVVTGTRIRRKDLTTPAPVSIVNRDALVNSGKISLGDFLQSVPEQGNSVNTQVNNGNDGSVNVSLRSLGAQRTLVLVNGRRMVYGGTGASGGIPAVDLNTIPVAAIERVEVLKDGASAVYGSDAIAGVVNVILKRKYTGSEASVYGGVTGHSDGQNADVSAITGTGNEHGNILFAAGFQQQLKVLAGDRSWSETTIGYDWDGSVTGQVGSKYATGNSSTFPNGRFTLPGLTRTAAGDITGCSGTPVAGATAAQIANYNAMCGTAVADQVSNFVPSFDGTATTYAPYDGSLYNTNPTNYLITPNRRIQIFSTGDANLGDVARAFFEASYVNRTSQQNLAPIPIVNNTIPNKPVSISAYSIYNPVGIDITSWRRRAVEFGNRFFSQNLDTFHIVTGLDGSLGDWASFARGWSWEAYYSYGRTQGTEVDAGQARMPQLADATGPSAVNPATGQPVCLRSPTGGFTTANIIPGCVPANMLGGAGTLDPNAKTYVGFDGTQKGYNEEQIWALNLSGELVALPTAERPMGLALGVEHRLEFAGFLPDVVTAHLESSGNNQLPSQGQYDATEGYAELSIPIVTNKPGVEDLELSAAIRAFNYSTFGSDSTYKFGGRYSPTRDVTLRGTYSTAFRAPSVIELYGGAADSFDSTRDPCRGAAAATRPECTANQPWGHVPAAGSGDPSTQFLSKRSPNPNLKPETATIYTAGIVLAPRAVPNLSATLDYYNIYLKHTIDIRTANYILNQCYTANDQTMCERVTRDANGVIQQIIDTRDNLGSTKTQGLDLAIRYGLPTPTIGRFNFIFDANYVIQYDTTDVSGVTDKHAGNYDNLIAMPRFKGNLSVLWAKGGLGLGVTGRYVGSMKECADANTDPGYCSNGDPTAATFSRTISQYLPIDLFLSYALKSRAGTTTVSAGVQNVFDATPPYIASAFAANSDPSTYDYLGRYFYLRLTQSI